MSQYVGLTGCMGSGKGEVANLLKQRGYKYISLSDMVREEATNRGLPHTRENLQNVGNQLREEHGAGALGRKVRETITKDMPGNWVIDGIRNPAEAEELKQLSDFQMVGVGAHIETIKKRLLQRNR